jgi:hypothetical protein
MLRILQLNAISVEAARRCSNRVALGIHDGESGARTHEFAVVRGSVNTLLWTAVPFNA